MKLVHIASLILWGWVTVHKVQKQRWERILLRNKPAVISLGQKQESRQKMKDNWESGVSRNTKLNYNPGEGIQNAWTVFLV